MKMMKVSWQIRRQSCGRDDPGFDLVSILTGGASSSRSWIRVRMSSMKAFMCLLSAERDINIIITYHRASFHEDIELLSCDSTITLR